MFRNLVAFSQRVGSRLSPRFQTSIPATGQHRNLYAPAALGVDSYVHACERVRDQFGNNQDTFRTKMQEYVTDNPKNLVFTEDLKNMVHLVDSSQDLEMVTHMIKKFHSQNKEMRFGNFVFGPVVMRMFYNMNAVDIAFKCFKDPLLNGFFDQLVSFQILMDMLYENGKYSEALEVFDEIQTKQLQGSKYPKHAVVLAFASCYKQNTPEAFKYCTNLWQCLNDVGHIPMRKAATFAAGLALRQNAPAIALEILSTIRNQNYYSVRNLKAIAYAESGRPDTAIVVLRSILEVDEPINKKRSFIRGAVDKVRQAIEKSGDKQLLGDFNKIEKYLSENGHISEESVEEMLCSEISSTSYITQKNARQAEGSTNTRRHQGGQGGKYNRRTQDRNDSRRGLSEYY